MAAGQTYLSPRIADIVVRTAVRQGDEARAGALVALTRREREVLQLVAEGKLPTRGKAGKRRLKAEAEKALARLVDEVRCGAFPPTDEPDDCTYCDYLNICGDPRQVAAGCRRKLAHPANRTFLKSFRELRGYVEA